MPDSKLSGKHTYGKRQFKDWQLVSHSGEVVGVEAAY